MLLGTLPFYMLLTRYLDFYMWQWSFEHLICIFWIKYTLLLSLLNSEFQSDCSFSLTCLTGDGVFLMSSLDLQWLSGGFLINLKAGKPWNLSTVRNWLMGRGILDGGKGWILSWQFVKYQSWDRNLVFELLIGAQAAGFGIPEEFRGVVIRL